MPKLTHDQIEEVLKEIVDEGVPVRFMHNGCSLIITTGETTSKGCNVIYQQVYWRFKKETSKKIAKWLGVKAVFSE
jgi:flagellar biosynthesis component FlhA